ncbi:MAG: bifunctional phosphopantothenoylcysteine decarboxylase/phosphopantothenate--cysteine ligase CoaBC [Lachnospiraceae bacterium]|nr:bifunctional phosphopantothenoylcysteine decarboxylase/phosphopantothenate--cysteine ligase CoaBC [Lachnospiraceae bacterium]
MDVLKGKKIILGVTGSIAAYKIAYLCSSLRKRGADTTVIMTKNALNFINPITFETLTGNKCLLDTFDRNFEYDVEHVELAKNADVFLTAPASANVMAKAACGIADDMLTTTLLACTCPKLFAPAMNTRMYLNPVTQDNILKLEHYGCRVIRPATGYLACGDTGEGKMPEPDELLEHIEYALTPKDMEGLRVLVTAGATRERMDPVRFITNNSTGKMGIALARAAYLRGAEVTLVYAGISVPLPLGPVAVKAESAAGMAEEVKNLSADRDIIIKAAAVADYTPSVVHDEKVKKKDGDLGIPLKRTEDILKWLGENRREGQFLCGFSMETENVLENSKEKLHKKNVDMIIANSLRVEGAGFGTDTNVVTVITKDAAKEFPIMSKKDVADEIFSEILRARD